MNTFIALSGGIDSTYNLYQWLKKNPKQRILVHHINYYSFEGRGDYEKKAVQDVLKWLRSKGYKNFKYVETTFDNSKFGRMGFDSEVLAPIHAFVIKRYKTLRTYILNAPKDEYDRLGSELQRRNEFSKKILETILGYQMNYITPLAKMSKQEIIADMPKDLLELCWYCRHPRADGSTCGQCHTCKQVKGVR